MQFRFRWSSDLTYYHRQYMKWYREIEDKEFEELSKKQVSKIYLQSTRVFSGCVLTQRSSANCESDETVTK